MVVQLTVAMERELGLTINPTALQEVATPRDIERFLLDHHPEACGTWAQRVSQSQPIELSESK
jgi:hypothetical protein